jgi:hypothetical protein
MSSQARHDPFFLLLFTAFRRAEHRKKKLLLVTDHDPGQFFMPFDQW